MKKTGLTLGKYAPLHKGHQYLIETAMSEVDEMYLLIYATDLLSVPLQIRAGWIRRLYPDVHVIECWNGPKGCGHDRAYQIQEENCIRSMLEKNGAPRITHFFSSEFYGEHVSKSLGAIDRRVDEARITVPISGCRIRENVFAGRQYIDDVVYPDLITKIVFMGSVSTGKSTLAEAMAKRWNTAFVSEYGREYWEKHQVNRRIPLEAFDEIAIGHITLEDEAVQRANRYLFVDTNAISTYMFSLDYHGRATEFLTRAALENQTRYDLFFLCDDDIPYCDTWDRSGDVKRHVFQRQIIADLNERKIPYITLKGSLEARMTQVDAIVARFNKFSNFYGNVLSG
ncbi:MAG: AAA family ATPase [Synergistaceae bacterium]|jgi:NadR type nicotinamide-nucleotide adenylyltransferase|nr:AAA family ATPase [Synergistaceae bacterium]